MGGRDNAIELMISFVIPLPACVPATSTTHDPASSNTQLVVSTTTGPSLYTSMTPILLSSSTRGRMHSMRSQLTRATT